MPAPAPQNTRSHGQDRAQRTTPGTAHESELAPEIADTIDPELDKELNREFDFGWARSSPEHELSAHGRSVQRRLDTPAPKSPSPSLWKRFRFRLYRAFNGR